METSWLMKGMGLLCCLVGAAGGMDIQGIVIDSVSRDPVPGARVAIGQDSTRYVTADQQGAFRLVYPPSTVVERSVGMPSREAHGLVRVHDLRGRAVPGPCSSPTNGVYVVAAGGATGMRITRSAIAMATSDRSWSSVTRSSRAGLFKSSAATYQLRITRTGYSSRSFTPGQSVMTNVKLALLPDSSGTINTLDDVLMDMTAPHEAKPHGVYVDWSEAPRWGSGVYAPGYALAFIAWGQIYETREGNPATNYRVNIRDMRAYALYKSDRLWHLVQATTGVDGSAYIEDFSNNTNKPADMRTEADGSTSVTVGGGYNFHFWPTSGRATLQWSNVAGLYTTFQARLIPNDPARPDDRDSCRVIGSVGGDWWRDLTAGWAADWSNNGDYAIGRFKYIRKQWRCYNAWAGDSTEFRRNPPPLD